MSGSHKFGLSCIPIGTIVMWCGDSHNIPEGWTLCNGIKPKDYFGEVPDLRDKFIVGAGNLYKTNDFGEPDQHSHVISDEERTLMAGLGGAHDHQSCAQIWYNNFAAEGKHTTVIDRRGMDVRRERTDVASDHSHKVTLPKRTYYTEFSSFSSGENKPNWYALCFIMRFK